MNSGEMLDTFIRSLLENKGFSETTTFAEFHARAKLNFRCYATCLQRSDIQEFSARKTPNHSILFALRASMCLPVIFAPMKDPFTESVYYDAALIHNMPFVFLTEEEKRHTLSVFFDIFGVSDLTHEITSLLTYAFKSFYNLRNVYYLKRYTDSIVRIPVDFTKFLDCNTKETKDELITLGYSTCMAFLDSAPNPVVRRYSIS
jgi:predicted acylesterase/phospholipase RssA